MSVRFGLLGPLEVTHDHGQPVALPRGKARVVLTALLLSPNTVVGVDRLIEAVWGQEPPYSDRQTIQFFVCKLRKALAADGGRGGEVLATEASGYLIRVAPEDLDVTRFETLIAAGRAEQAAEQPAAAARTFAGALALWRGPVLADVAEADFFQPDIVRLEELRMAAVEDWVEARLALGQHAELVPELEALVHAHPLRERLCGQIMLALYRSQRQADALGAYRATRRRFAEELGMQPGAELRWLERAILSQDPALDPPARGRSRHQADPATAAAMIDAPAPTPSCSVRPSAVLDAAAAVHVEADGSMATTHPVLPVRRLVTVLVAGLAAPSTDPEIVHGQRTWLLKKVADEVARFGGMTHPTPGGSVVAIFGAQHAREDDPERAVRAALGMCALGDGDWRLRVGLDTGHALVLPDQTGIEGLTGRVLDAAAALQATAPIAGVLVGSATYHATRRVITYDPAPTPAPWRSGWRAISPRARIGVAAEVENAEPAFLVERERELEVLQQLLERVRTSREPQLVTLIGEPGIGKTRLVHELGRLVEADPDLIVWRQGRCPPAAATGDGDVFQALAEITIAHSGILPTDSSQVAVSKLRQAVSANIADPREAVTVAEHLISLVSQDPHRPAADHDRQATLVAAWTRLVEAIAAERPLVVVVEDLHEAHPELLEAVGGLVDEVESVPLLVIATARSELLTAKPGWGGGKRNATSLQLGPLTEAGSSALLDSLLDSAGITLRATTRASALERAAGNPLYIREYVRMLGDRYECADMAGDRLPIPATVQQVVAARLDALVPGDRSLLGALAVLGDGSGTDALVAISGRDETTISAGLARLGHCDLVRRTRGHPGTSRWGYAVGHPLIGEVAYQQLLRAERAGLHQRAAVWLEGLAADRADHIERIAHHYERAVALAQGIGTPPVTVPAGLAERARMALLAAGRQAMALGSLGLAARRLRQALAIWPTDDPEHPVLLLELGRALTYSAHTGAEVLIRARDAFVAAGRQELAAEAEAVLGHLARIQVQPGQAADYVASALGRPVPVGPARMEALTVQAIDLLVADHHRDAIKIASQVMELAGALGLADHEANGRSIRSQAQLMAGDLTAMADAEEALAQLDACRFPMRVLAHFGFAHALYWTGDLDRCVTAISAGRQAAAAAGAGVRTWFDVLEAGTLYHAGLWPDAETLIGRVLADDPGSHGTYPIPWARIILGRMALGRGDLDQATTEVNAALRAAEAAHDARYQQAARALLGRILLAGGEHADAAAMLQRLVSSLAVHPACATLDLGLLLTDLGSPAGMLPSGLPPTRWHAAVRALATGDLHAAAEQLSALGALVDEAAVRLRLARSLAAAGQPAAAADQADQAAAVFRKAGASSDLHHAETLLGSGFESSPAGAARRGRPNRSSA